MSTTLLPPSHYVVRSRDHGPHTFPTLTQAAAELIRLDRIPVAVNAVNGIRARPLNDSERRELGQRVRAILREHPRPTRRAQAAATARTLSDRDEPA